MRFLSPRTLDILANSHQDFLPHRQSGATHNHPERSQTHITSSYVASRSLEPSYNDDLPFGEELNRISALSMKVAEE
jgi:hypothetical protein